MSRLAHYDISRIHPSLRNLLVIFCHHICLRNLYGRTMWKTPRNADVLTYIIG